MDETNWRRHCAPQTNNMQRTETPIGSKGTKKGTGRGGSNLRLQWIYRLYIQTNRLEKVKGWHSRVLNVVAPGGRCVYEQRYQFYVQVQVKVEEDEVSRRPLQSNKNQNQTNPIWRT